MHFVILFTLVIIPFNTPVVVSVMSYGCEDNKNFVLFCDNYISEEEVFECHSYIARLAVSLRTISDGNRVAVASFSSMANTLKDSEPQKVHAWEHDILRWWHWGRWPWSYLQRALENTRAYLKEAEKDRVFVALYIIGSKSKDDKINAENEEGAKKLYKDNPNFVGFTVTVGKSEDIHEGTVRALNGGHKSRSWNIRTNHELDKLEGIMHVRLACDSSTGLTNDSDTVSITIFSDSFYKGEELTLQLGPDECIDLDDYTMGSSMANWEDMVRSIKHHHNCVLLFVNGSCTGYYFPASEFDEGLPVISEGYDGWTKMTKSIQRCPPEDGKGKQSYISVFNKKDYGGQEKRIEVSTIQNCHRMEDGYYSQDFASMRPNGNCVEVYFGDNCEKAWQFKITTDIPDFGDVRNVQSIRACSNSSTGNDTRTTTPRPGPVVATVKPKTTVKTTTTTTTTTRRTTVKPIPIATTPKPIGDGSITFYSEENYKGQEWTLQIPPGGTECHNLDEQKYRAKDGSIWLMKVKSIKNHGACVHLASYNGCSNTYYPVDEGTSEIPIFMFHSGEQMVASYRKCPYHDKNPPKLSYISLYGDPDFVGKEKRIEVSLIQKDVKNNKCHLLDRKKFKLESIRVNGNCVVLVRYKIKSSTCDGFVDDRRISHDMNVGFMSTYALKLCD